MDGICCTTSLYRKIGWITFTSVWYFKHNLKILWDYIQTYFCRLKEHLGLSRRLCTGGRDFRNRVNQDEKPYHLFWKDMCYPGVGWPWHCGKPNSFGSQWFGWKYSVQLRCTEAQWHSERTLTLKAGAVSPFALLLIFSATWRIGSDEDPLDVA